MQRYRDERNTKKSRIKELRKTEQRDLLVWSLTNSLGLKNALGLLRFRKLAMAHRSTRPIMKLEPLAKLVANLKKAGPDIGLIASLELRHRTITRLIAEFAEYADKPGHQGDRRLACRGSSYAPMSWD